MSTEEIATPSGTALYRFHTGPNGTTIIHIRRTEPDENEAIRDARNVVALFAHRTPFHRLSSAKVSLDTAWQALAGSEQEAAATLRRRALSALRDFASATRAQAPMWREDVAAVHLTELTTQEPLGAALGTYLQTRVIRLANEVSSTPGLHVASPDSPQDTPTSFLVEGETYELVPVVNDWMTSAQHLLANALIAAKAAIDGASSTILRVIAEGLGDPVFIAPVPTNSSGELSFEIDLLDLRAVQAVQDLMIQAQSLRSQSTPDDASMKDGAKKPPAKTGDSGTEAAQPPTQLQEKPDTSTIATPIELLELNIEIQRVVEAMANSHEGLLNSWNSRFPLTEYMQAVEIERTLAASLTTTVMRALGSGSAGGEDSTAARDATLPASTEELLKWLSTTPQSTAEVERLHLFAIVHSLQRYLSALEAIKKPSRFEFSLNQVTVMQFSPARALHLYDNGSLLAETVADLEGRGVSRQTQMVTGVETKPALDRELLRLIRAVKACRHAGLPEGELVYLTRLFDWTNPELSSENSELVARAREEVSTFPSNRILATSVAIVLADRLASIFRGARALTS